MTPSVATDESLGSRTAFGTPAGRPVTVVAVIAALACVGFAAVNVLFEFTDRFDDGPYADYAAGISVVNWVVVVLKLVGAAVALLSVAKRPRYASPKVVALALWGAFALLSLYGVGSLVQVVGMLAGVAGSADDVDAAGIVYVTGFLAAAVGFGVLAVSHSRRYRTGRRVVVLGAVGAPVLLGTLLVAIPALLVALGVMPSY